MEPSLIQEALLNATIVVNTSVESDVSAMCRILRSSGFNNVLVSSTADLSELVQTHDPQLIILQAPTFETSIQTGLNAISESNVTVLLILDELPTVGGVKNRVLVKPVDGANLVWEVTTSLYEKLNSVPRSHLKVSDIATSIYKTFG